MKSALIVILLGSSALTAWPALAQQPAEAPPAQTAPATPAPAAPTAAAPAAAQAPAAPQQAQRGPANVCQELVAYLRQPAPGQTPAPQPAPAGQAPAAQVPGQQPVPPGAPNVGPQASSAGTSVPQGGSAPAVEAPKGPAAPPPGKDATGPQVSGQPAPIPQAPPTTKPPPVSLEHAEALAQGNDIAGCRDAAQKVRRAGLKMPDALIALAGLKLELHQPRP